MRPGPAIAFAVVALFVTDVLAQGKNERTRRATSSSSSSTSSSGSGSKKSANRTRSTSSSTSDDFAGTLSFCLDMLQLCAACASEPRPRVTVVRGVDVSTVPPQVSAPPGPDFAASFDAAGHWALDDNLILAPRLTARMELWTSSAGVLRAEVDHVTYAERVPVSAPGENVLPFWDPMHLTALRLGWLGAGDGWMAGGRAGVRLLPGRTAVAVGAELGVEGRADLTGIFFEGAASFIAFDEALALEPVLRVGLSGELVEGFFGWRALQFLRDGDFIPYFGPEIGVRLRL